MFLERNVHSKKPATSRPEDHQISASISGPYSPTTLFILSVGTRVSNFVVSRSEQPQTRRYNEVEVFSVFTGCPSQWSLIVNVVHAFVFTRGFANVDDESDPPSFHIPLHSVE